MSAAGLKLQGGVKSVNDLAARSAVLAFAMGPNVREHKLGAGVGRLLGVKRKTLYEAAKRRAVDIEGQEYGGWAKMHWETKNLGLSEEKRTAAFFYWHNNTRPSSNTKDVVRDRIGRKHWQTHGKHWLEVPSPAFYQTYCEDEASSCQCPSAPSSSASPSMSRQ